MSPAERLVVKSIASRPDLPADVREILTELLGSNVPNGRGPRGGLSSTERSRKHRSKGSDRAANPLRETEGNGNATGNATETQRAPLARADTRSRSLSLGDLKPSKTSTGDLDPIPAREQGGLQRSEARLATGSATDSRFRLLGEAESEPAANDRAPREPKQPITELDEPRLRGNRTLAKADARRGSRLPSAWSPNPETVAWCAKQDVDAAACVAEFQDYWRSVTGPSGIRLDWDATFRNRVRDLVRLCRAPKLPMREWTPPADAAGDAAQRAQAQGVIAALTNARSIVVEPRKATGHGGT